MNRNLFTKAMMLIITLVLATGITQAAGKIQTKECQIKTSAHCGSCKTTIENGLNKVDGVKSSTLNLEDKIVTVKYDPSKTDPDKLKSEVASLGYTADVVKAKEGCCPGNKAKNTSSCKDKGCSSTCGGAKALKTINK